MANSTVKDDTNRGRDRTVIALSVLFDLVAFLRDVRYWRQVLEGGYYLSGLPQYHLSYTVLPGWLLQTREFYSLTGLSSAPPKEVLIGLIIPLLLIAAILFGIKRRPAALIVVLVLLVYAAMGEFTSAAHNCSYCTDRTLLPIVPLAIGLLVFGIVGLATARNGLLKFIGVAITVIAVVAVGARTRQERLRFADGAYFLDSSNRALLTHLQHYAGSVELEAYGQDPVMHPVSWSSLIFLASSRATATSPCRANTPTTLACLFD